MLSIGINGYAANSIGKVLKNIGETGFKGGAFAFVG